MVFLLIHLPSSIFHFGNKYKNSGLSPRGHLAGAKEWNDYSQNIEAVHFYLSWSSFQVEAASQVVVNQKL